MSRFSRIGPVAISLAVVLAIVVPLVLAAPASAAIGNWEPSRTFSVDGSGHGDDKATDVAVTSGATWVCGQVRNAAGDLDASLVRITHDSPAFALTSWDSVEHLNDANYDIAVRGAYIYTAGASRRSATDLDLLLVRWSTTGGVKWAARFAGGANKDDAATDVVVDRDGRAIVCGTQTTKGGGVDWIVAKYSAAGQRLWTWRYDGQVHLQDAPAEMYLDGSGNVYITGFVTVTASVNTHSALTVKLSPDGEPIWAKKYSGPDGRGADATALARCPSGGVYVGGQVSTTAGGLDGLLLRYDPKGGRKVYDRFTGVYDRNEQMVNDIAVLSDRRIIAVGSDRSYGGSDPDPVTVLWNSGGSIAESRRGVQYGSDREGYSWRAVAADPFGGYALTGLANVDGSHLWVTERRTIYDEAGQWRWMTPWAIRAEDPAAIAVRDTLVVSVGHMPSALGDANQYITIWRY